MHLICFGTGSVIHGVQTALVAKRWCYTTGKAHTAAYQGLAICLLCFFWQFGNFFRELVQTIGFLERTILWNLGNFASAVALFCFPLLFSYMYWASDVEKSSGLIRILIRFSRASRYPLWPWTIFIIVADAVSYWKSSPWIPDPNFTSQMTLYIMLFFFLVFSAEGVLERRDRAVSAGPVLRANRAAIIASFAAAGFFILMLFQWDKIRPYQDYISLAAMMTSVPFTISAAYRMYQFPFMDAFLRETLSGVILLTALVIAFAVGSSWNNQDLLAFWLVSVAVVLTYAKDPLTRWVERALMGYQETIEEQEERVGNAIRALTRLDEFGARVSEILSSELEAEWVEIGSVARNDAVHRFEIPGPSSLWLSVGPRIGGRQYMSRQLRLVRTAALQLATHHHQLTQHQLRELTARAQMRALQAQINPHFLFNTLNVLANLIHTNTAKAEHVTEELAEIFRYALESTRVEWVRLEDELRFLESYLEIEKARFEERLAYSFEVDENLRSLRIPPMILQPLVENAIKHGISPKVEGGEVRITGQLESDRLQLIVEDTGAGHLNRSRQRGSGIGLTNVRERLQHVYGDAGSLKLEELSPAGTRAVLVLPHLVGVHS